MEIREIDSGNGWVCNECEGVRWLRLDVLGQDLEAVLDDLNARFGRQHPHWVVDLARSEYVDSRALGALLQLVDQHAETGALVVLAGASNRATLAFQMLGFKERFHWFKTADEAQAFVLMEGRQRLSGSKPS